MRAEKLLVFKDLDDTDRLSRIADRNFGAWLEMAVNLLRNESFMGSAEINKAFAKKSNFYEIHYVTVAPTFVRWHIDAFLHTNHFPPVALERIHTRDSLSLPKVDHKVSAIVKVMEAQPQARAIFIMDNGEHDVEIADFLRDHSSVGSRIDHVFMHKLYHRPRGERLKHDQTAYYTAVDLAFRLLSLNYIEEDDFVEVLQATLFGLESGDFRLVERVWPSFAHESWDNMTQAFDVFLSYRLKPQTRELLSRYLVALESRVRYVNSLPCHQLFPTTFVREQKF